MVVVLVLDARTGEGIERQGGVVDLLGAEIAELVVAAGGIGAGFAGILDGELNPGAGDGGAGAEDLGGAILGGTIFGGPDVDLAADESVALEEGGFGISALVPHVEHGEGGCGVIAEEDGDLGGVTGVDEGGAFPAAVGEIAELVENVLVNVEGADGAAEAFGDGGVLLAHQEDAVSEAFAGAEGVFLKEVGGTEACEAIEQAGITADLGGIGDGLTEAIDDLVVSNAACFDLAGVVEIEVIDASTGESRAVVEAVSSPNGFADLAVDQHPDRVAVDSKGSLAIGDAAQGVLGIGAIGEEGFDAVLSTCARFDHGLTAIHGRRALARQAIDREAQDVAGLVGIGRSGEGVFLVGVDPADSHVEDAFRCYFESGIVEAVRGVEVDGAWLGASRRIPFPPDVVQTQEMGIETDRIDACGDLLGGQIVGNLLDVGKAVIGDDIGSGGADGTIDDADGTGNEFVVVGLGGIRHIEHLIDAALVVITGQEGHVGDAVVGNELEQVIALGPVATHPGFAAIVA